MLSYQIRSPWIGEVYRTLPKEKRVMILGESHYTDLNDQYDANLSQRVIKALLRCEKFRFFTCITTAIENKNYNDINIKDFWNSLSYANFCQGGVISGKGGGNKQMFADGIIAFPEVLRIAQPSKILVFSYKAWGHMSEFDNTIVQNSLPIKTDLITAATRTLVAKDGSFNCEALRVRHPTGWQGRKVWHPVIKEFLDRPLAA